jgi:hypothetical protein
MIIENHGDQQHCQDLARPAAASRMGCNPHRCWNGVLLQSSIFQDHAGRERALDCESGARPFQQVGVDVEASTPIALSLNLFNPEYFRGD